MNGFWLFMLGVNLIIPLTMIGFGRFFLNRTPGRINRLFGYRTTRSIQNDDTWAFAHGYCGRLWVFWGRILLAVSPVAMIPVLGRDIETTGLYGAALTVLQSVVLLGSILATERALKRTFDQNGIRIADGSSGR